MVLCDSALPFEDEKVMLPEDVPMNTLSIDYVRVLYVILV